MSLNDKQQSKERIRVIQTLEGISLIPVPPEYDQLKAARLVAVAAPAAFLAVLAKAFLEAAMKKFVDSVFGGGSKGADDFAALMNQMCQYICSYISRQIEESRIWTKLDIASEKLDLVQRQLSLGATSPNPRSIYEALIENGLLSSALAAYSSIGKEAEVGDVGYVNYAVAAALEIRLLIELTRLKSDIVDLGTVKQQIATHQTYLKEASVNLHSLLDNQIKVGAHFSIGYPNSVENMTSNPATKPNDPAAPERRDFEAWLTKYCWNLPPGFKGMAVPIIFWVQKTEPRTKLGFVVLKQKNISLPWATPGVPSFNEQARANIDEMRIEEQHTVDGMLSSLDATVIRPTDSVVASWEKLLAQIEKRKN